MPEEAREDGREGEEENSSFLGQPPVHQAGSETHVWAFRLSWAGETLTSVSSHTFTHESADCLGEQSTLSLIFMLFTSCEPCAMS